MNTKKDAIRRLENRLVMKNADLAKIVGNNVQVKRLADSGAIIALGSGFYAHPSVDPFLAYVLVVARYYPDAVISNITSLVIHALSDERVEGIDVDIGRNRSIRNRIFRAHRVPDAHLIGMTTIEYVGHAIKIYDVERSLCDAYKIDPGGHIFFKAVKRYVASSAVNIGRIRRYDEVLRTKVTRAVAQELADG